MFNFLHSFHPQPILLTLGPVHLYWYGFFIMLGALSALIVAIKLAKIYGLKKDLIIDLAVWLIIGGIIGARIYHVLLELPYYAANPVAILKVWQGGIAIHGAIIGGLITLWLFTKKHKQNFWQLTAIITTAMPLAQAIGRWGNYFNQELFGLPTNLPWSIPIDPINRPWQYLSNDYFHPTFLYESIGNLFIFLLLLMLFIMFAKKRSYAAQIQILNFKFQIIIYLFLYSSLRFSLEFLRLDPTPLILGWRLPQPISLLIIFPCLIFTIFQFTKYRKINPLEK